MAGWFKQYPPNTPVRQVANIKENNLIRAIFDDLQGIGCRVIKPKGLMGRGWRIVVDGASDVDPIPDSAVGTDTGQIPYKPYDLVSAIGVPRGVIAMWHAPNGEAVPTGWAECDGTKGTPDMRGRFPAGRKSGDTYFDVLTTGGAIKHTHTISLTVDTAAPAEGYNIGGAGADHAFINTSADSVVHLPPYYITRFIMKL